MWRNSETRAYWPYLIATDPSPVFKDTDVYVAGFDTPQSGGKMTIADLVSEISNRMDADRVFADHNEVVFIAHSMGGLLTQELLLTYGDRGLAKKVNVIFLYGTPLEGSPLANWFKLFKSDPALKELQAGDNFTLHSLDQRWLHAGFQHIKRLCAYEVRPEKGFKVVDRYSATRGCDDQTAIDSDHHHLVEPADRSADAYIFVSNKLDTTPARPPLSESTRTSPAPGQATSQATASNLETPKVSAPNGIAIGGNNTGTATVTNNYQTTSVTYPYDGSFKRVQSGGLDV